MGQAFPKPALRPFLPADTDILAEIFRASVEELTGDDYSETQQASWAATADEEEFAAKLAGELTLVATIAGAPVGFISLKGADHVDMLYVHPGVARQGVATALYEALERLAAARGAKQLMVDASDTARSFFERLGFDAKYRNTKSLGGEWLGNTHMQKRLVKTEMKGAAQ
jgi:putative acetyltransferase